MTDLAKLLKSCQKTFKDVLIACEVSEDQLWLQIAPANIQSVCQQLRDDLHFEQLIDVVGVDYALYGQSEWETAEATCHGFSRAADRFPTQWNIEPNQRFAVLYHLLSVQDNVRLTVECVLDEDKPFLDTVVGIWPSANWHEREVFDLFGILFEGHPDLRRILTDYGFVGYPFRKDFPISGHVEMRYDESLGRIVYEPVEIEPRVLVPRVIRDDSRYEAGYEPATGDAS